MPIILIKMNKLILCIAMFFLLNEHVKAHVVEVTVESDGKTTQEAIANALVQALQQITGVALNSTQTMKMADKTTEASDGSSTKSASFTAEEESQGEIRSKSGGIVKSYRVIDEKKDTINVNIKLTVNIEVFDPSGVSSDNRKKIVVLPFRNINNDVTGFGELMGSRIKSYLTQSRRFALLDRDNANAINSEMSLIASNKTSILEKSKLGHALGTDFILTGEIRNVSGSSSDHTIAISDERIQKSDLFVEADFSLIEVATGQIKWSGTKRDSLVSEGIANERDPTLVNRLIESVAAMIANELTENIYPMRIVNATDPNAIVINQGGDTVNEGEQLEVFLLDKMMRDPYTKEPLGRKENSIGMLQITRVNAKVSYGKIIKGGLPASTTDIIVRRLHYDNAPAINSANTPPPVIKLPFDP